MGQQVDIEKPTEPRDILRLMELKTGALFGAAAACGAMCADIDDAGVSRFYEWGKNLGVLFQRLDDIADGDGAADMALNRDAEVESLRAELRSLHSKPMPLAEAVYGIVVGEEA